MIDLDDLETFVAVARAGSFVEAARRTRTPTSTVSRSIARLEERLGVRLFHRTSRRVSPSADGERLLARVGPHIDGLAEITAETRERASEPVGRLRVTAPVVSGSTWIGKALAAFAEAYPRVRVELHVTNAIVDLVAEGFDLGVRAGPVEDTSLVARKITQAGHVLAASPAFVARELGGRTTLTRADLERLPAVVHRHGTHWTFVGEEGEIAILPNERFAVDDPRVAIDAAVAGMGIVRAAASLLEGRGLVALSTDWGCLAPRALYAVHPGRAPRRVRLAIEHLARRAPR
jgi:DNA-binding transcriptional LysR family regulator